MTSKGHETWLNAELMRCDLKVLTGFIEPHLFAGFSGGGKAIMPGMAGQRTVLGNHDAGMVGHPRGHLGRHPRQSHLGGGARGRRPGRAASSFSTSRSTATRP